MILRHPEVHGFEADLFAMGLLMHVGDTQSLSDYLEKYPGKTGCCLLMLASNLVNRMRRALGTAFRAGGMKEGLMT